MATFLSHILFGAGSVGAAVALSAHTVSDTTTSPTHAESRFRLNTNGKAQYYQSVPATYTDISGEWLKYGVSSSYECRATLVSGTLSTGTTGSWLALSSSQEWTVTKSTVGLKSCTFTLEIRQAGSGTVVASASIELDAEVDT